eukprot:TRINITY_DN1892_c0_g2_i1.p1 TRINITY_DN1892_c0_g2~~TRINITY_DN1892_c0_g2_i1.p1  ORF type:complete len:383 (-),score=83.70 TRINITY_DN1892_c0_g2_i1:315-1463(-)
MVLSALALSHRTLSRTLLRSNKRMMATQAEILEQPGTYGRTVTLNRPKALNALNLPMVRTLLPMYREYEENEAVKVIVMKGAGGKAFCAGGDVREIVRLSKAKDPTASAFFREEYQLNHLIGSSRVPQVALLDGITMGGGVGLSVHGRFKVATENTLFAMPETAIGFFCDVGGSYFLPRLDRSLGMYLALTGARLKGADLVHAGIATHYIASEMLGVVTENLELTNHSRDVRITKQLLDEAADLPKELPPPSYAENIETIEKAFSQKSVEEIARVLKQEGTPFALKTLETMRKMSPLSVKVVFKQIRNGAVLSFEECFKQEFRLATRFLADSDFQEGVTALLEEKRAASWKYSRWEDVPDTVVNSFFEPLAASEEWKPIVRS